jgi:hypothetical protein
MAVTANRPNAVRESTDHLYGSNAIDTTILSQCGSKGYYHAADILSIAAICTTRIGQIADVS